MSTRANIKIVGERHDGTYFIDRSHDGFPDEVLPDIQQAITACKGRWRGAEPGQLVSYFFGHNFNPNYRLQLYEICDGPAGDESYNYWIKWDAAAKEYTYGVAGQ